MAIDFKKAIVDFLSPELNMNLKLLQSQNTELGNKLNKVSKNLDVTNSLYVAEVDKNKLLTSQIVVLSTPKVNVLEQFCSKNYSQIDNVRYNQKRKIAGKYYAIELNQFITPGQFEVQKFKKKLKLSNSLFTDAKIIGDTVAQLMTWTDDKNLDTSGDYYLYAEEILCLTKGDCEDHAFLVSSIQPEIGVAYGFLLDQNGKRIGGHAFNVFVYADTLYILDTVGNSAYMQNYNGQRYYINYIITPSKTFALDSTISFGTIAGWN
jgi:hypothetical protein